MKKICANVFGSFFVLALTTACIARQSDVPEPVLANSVVKVLTTYRAPDLRRPWTKLPSEEVTGTGVVIEGQRIITNAHVAEHATRIQIQPAQSTKKYIVEVEALANGIDLALLRFRNDSEAEEFFSKHPPLVFRDELPRSGEDVEVYGYPLGGDQVSTTKGVVSRIDFSNYVNLNPGLVIQVDAAINPGNSGGPAVHDGKLIGVVFSKISEADNVGYIIPTEEVRAFLSDVADGVYDGRERMMIGYASIESPQLREFLRVPPEVTGVYVTPDSSKGEFGELQQWDVVTRFGEYDIDNTGTVAIRDDIRVNFDYLTPQYADQDGNVELLVWRNGQEVKAKVPTFKKVPWTLPFLGADYPEYFIYGPLCFMPAYADFLASGNAVALAVRDSPISEEILEFQRFEGEGYVCVLAPMFTHEITEGYAPLDLPTLRSVNGTEIKSLDHLVEFLRDSTDEWLVFTWYDKGQDDTVFRRIDAQSATDEILDENGIRRQMSERLEPIWKNDSKPSGP